MLEESDALAIVKADLANLVASARREGHDHAEVYAYIMYLYTHSPLCPY